MSEENRSALPPLNKSPESKSIRQNEKYLFNPNDFQVMKNLKKDAYDVINLVTNKKSQQKYISETIPLQLDPKNQSIISKKITKLIEISNPSINKYLLFSSIDFDGKKNLTIIMSCDHIRTLIQLLHDSSYDNTQKQKVLAGIAHGMNFLHEQDIIHGDLKLQNILIKKDHQPLVNNYGLSKFYNNQDLMQKISLDVTSASYIAPEVMIQQKLTQKSDVYAFGILMYEILQEMQAYSNIPNFSMLKPSSLIEKVQNGLRPSFIKPIKKGLKNIIEDCWSQDPNKRPTFGDIFQKLSLLSEKEDFTSLNEDSMNYCLENVDLDNFYSFIKEIQKTDKKVVSDQKLQDLLDENSKLKKENEKLKKSNDQISIQMQNYEKILFKMATIEVFNSFTMNSQLSYISERNTNSPKPNLFLTKVSKVLFYLQQFDQKGNGFYIQIISEDMNRPMSKVGKKCQLLILSSATEILQQNNLLNSPKFTNLLKEFKEGVIIEVLYPSSQYESTYNTVLAFRNKTKRRIKLGVFINTKERTDSTFRDNKDIDCVRIGDSVLSVEGDPFNEIGAFKGCSMLERVEFSSSVISIDKRSFKDCTSLTQIVIPSSVNSIGSYAFSGCSKLKTIVINSTSFCVIEDNLFEDCSSLTKIVITSMISEIGKNAFKGCKSLSKIELLNSVISIGDAAFYGCEELKEAVFPNSINSIGNFTFAGCTSLKCFKVPSSVKQIGFRAFKGCTGLKMVKIPDSVNYISDLAFEDCTALEKVSVPSSITFMADNAFPSTTTVIKT